MLPDAVLINVARGGVVDEEALVEALEARTIKGATLDVTEPEPLPPTSLLWGLDNCVITPHGAGLLAALGRTPGDALHRESGTLCAGRVVG